MFDGYVQNGDNKSTIIQMVLLLCFTLLTLMLTGGAIAAFASTTRFVFRHAFVFFFLFPLPFSRKFVAGNVDFSFRIFMCFVRMCFVFCVSFIYSTVVFQASFFCRTM